jgi:RNA recognition motif-containing protein
VRNPTTGEPTNSGFIEFMDQETATTALEALDGSRTSLGESISLSYARPRRTQTLNRQGSFAGSRMRRSSPRWND